MLWLFLVFQVVISIPLNVDKARDIIPFWQACADINCVDGYVCAIQRSAEFCTALCVEAGEITCNNVDCIPGKTCINEVVICKKAPCYPSPQCVPLNDESSNGYATPKLAECHAAPNCPKGEIWNGCGGCEGTCESGPVVCRVCNPELATCRCQYPLVRGPKGNCIDLLDCPRGYGLTGRTPSIPTPSPNSDPYNQCKSLDCSPDQFCTVEITGEFKCKLNPGVDCYCGDSEICLIHETECFPPGSGACPPTSQCIPPTECDDTEIYSPCGAWCENKCQSLCEPLACILICGPPACACKEDYYRDVKTGNCVPKSDCEKCLEGYATPVGTTTELITTGPPICGLHEVSSQCGNACEGKCRDVCSQPLACPEICGPPACACEQDFYRNEREQCVTKEECLLECPNPPYRTTTPVYSLSTSPNHPKLTCANALCVPGYRCEDLPEGPNCVPIMECGDNEEINQCGSQCEEKCSNHCENYPCPPVCPGPACACKTGFYRDERTENCVERSQCEDCPKEYGHGSPDEGPDGNGEIEVPPAITCANVRCAARTHCVDGPTGPSCVPNHCGENEELDMCGAGCEGNCKYKCEPQACSFICRSPACACKADFYRNDETGKCVSRESCKECSSYGIPPEPVYDTTPEPHVVCNLFCPFGKRCKIVDNKPICVDEGHDGKASISDYGNDKNPHHSGNAPGMNPCHKFYCASPSTCIVDGSEPRCLTPMINENPYN